MSEVGIERCNGCGAWVWHPEVYGCPTCRAHATLTLKAAS